MTGFPSLASGAWRSILGAIVLLAWAATACAAVPSADTTDEAFAATVPAAGRSPDELKPAYLEALKRVIVAVTGREEAGRDAVLLARFGDPAGYVERYRPDGAGIRVQFDRSMTSAVLISAGYLPAPADAGVTGAGNATAIRVIVGNINGPDDYGAVLEAFRALPTRIGVSVVGALGDTVTFVVSSRAGAEAVKNALSGQKSLTAETPSAAGSVESGDALRYRYTSGT